MEVLLSDQTYLVQTLPKSQPPPFPWISATTLYDNFLASRRPPEFFGNNTRDIPQTEGAAAAALSVLSPERRLPQHPGLAGDRPVVVVGGGGGGGGGLGGVHGALAPPQRLALAPPQRAGAAVPGASLRAGPRPRLAMHRIGQCTG